MFLLACGLIAGSRSEYRSRIILCDIRTNVKYRTKYLARPASAFYPSVKGAEEHLAGKE
jgi:hypothetical protein